MKMPTIICWLLQKGILYIDLQFIWTQQTWILIFLKLIYRYKVLNIYVYIFSIQTIFDALKTIYGPQSSGATTLLSADGTSLLTGKGASSKGWAEHFDGVLNRPSSINDDAINRLPQVDCNPLLDELPTISETVKAIKLLLSGNAPGSDVIPAEIYKAVGPPVAEKLTELFHIMSRKEAIPQEFKDATIIHLF